MQLLPQARKPASQVKHLIEASMFARICDQCLAECQDLLPTGNAT